MIKMDLVIESGGWEVRTTGEIEESSIRFTVRRPIQERIGFKCEVDAEILRKAAGLEFNLVHKKILPRFVKDVILSMIEEVLRDRGVTIEPALVLVKSLPQNLPRAL
jgi:hypothetical protein